MLFSWNPSAFVWQKRNVRRNKTSIRKQQKHVLSTVQSRFKWGKKKKKAFMMGTFIPNLPEGFLFLKFLFFKVLFDPRIIEKTFFFKNESVRSIENLTSMDQTVESFWLKFVLTHRLVNYSSLNVLREIESL